MQEEKINDENLSEKDEPSLVGELSGKCGDNVYYTLSDAGVLTISGSGDMYDWDDYASLPWWDNMNDIVKVVIEPGVTRIGAFAFSSCEDLRKVEFTGNAPIFE